MKKRILLSIIVVGVLIVSSISVNAVMKNDKGKRIVEKIRFSQPIISEKNGYSMISFKETNSFLMETGKPMLPSFTKTFTFPFGTKIKSVTCEPRGIKQTIISKDIQPAPEPMIVGSIKAKRNTVVKKKADVYNSVNPYPDKWYNYRVGTGLDKGNHAVILDIQFYPLRYNPAENLVEYTSNVEITINHEEPEKSILFPDTYDLLIIAPDEFCGKRDSLQDLVDYKNDIGIKTKLVNLNKDIESRSITLDNVNDIMSLTAQGRDTQEKIKYYIKNAIEEWGIDYVLLVGGSLKLPVRKTHIRIYVEGEPDDEEIFVSDLYYADIYDEDNNFCSWDSNENDNFGEYNWIPMQGLTDKVDLYPDVYLGRLACTSEREVSDVVDKIINYEKSDASKQSWFKKLIVCGGDSFPYDNYNVDEGEYVNEAVMDVMDSFTPDKIWISNGKLPKKKNLNDALKKGAGFVDFSGHGNEILWASHKHNDNRWIPTLTGIPSSLGGGYESSDVSSLSNRDNLPIVVIGACSCSKFNVAHDCFSWSFVSNPKGGGIASFGAAGLGWAYLGKHVTEGLIEKMVIDTFKAYDYGADTFGEMWSDALSRYISVGMSAFDYKTVEEWQPFGDPSLKIGGRGKENKNTSYTPDFVGFFNNKRILLSEQNLTDKQEK